MKPDQVEMMDRKRRKLLTINLIFIFIYLIVMMWEFMALYKQSEVTINLVDLPEKLVNLKGSIDKVVDGKIHHSIEKYSITTLPKGDLELKSNQEEIFKRYENLKDFELQNEALLKDLETINHIFMQNVETPHFFWVIVLVLQLPLSIVMYRTGKDIKREPDLDFALNNELVQFNRLKAWRSAFFASIISLFVLAFIPATHFSLAWVGSVATCVGFAAYIITFLRLDRGE